ncbi:MAG: superoxide dismutase [Candidatus Micrarchaeota archaeon]|nr:superoxide dismutase [Candidatus Micrarchaeota archaeon]
MSNSEGKHAVKAMPVSYDKVKEVMDEETYKWHHDTHYAGYVNKRNEVEVALQTVDRTKANMNYSAFRSLKSEETWNANGQILHEAYWDTMGGDGKYEDGMEIIRKINEDFGSVQAWIDDFVATGKTGKGWAVLSLDLLSDGKLRNFQYDAHNQGGVVGSAPIIAVDSFEHAYYHKYGPDRAGYLKALVSNIDWKKANERFRRLSR